MAAVKALLLYSFLLYLITFTLSSCDLFNGTKEDYLLQKIDDEIAWANAARLTVRVDYPVEWGASPQQGDLNRDNTRKGYEFNVEFTPMPGYGFEKWLAFPTAEYNGLDKTRTAVDIEASALNGSDVNITFSEGVSGAKIAVVTIFTEVPVTLVPWCNNRPALDQRTNPPLNPILAPFPYDQRVNIWFTMPVDTGTVRLAGEDPTITIAGIRASGNERGQPFNRNGEDGDLRGYFDLEFPPAPDPGKPHLNNRVNLIPKTNAHEIALLAIIITVGPGIENESGVAMTTPALISYQTDMTEAKKTYRAQNIEARAAHSVFEGYFGNTEFSRPDIDRRFRQPDKNTVFIRFSVEAPPDAPDLFPNRFRVVEQMVYNLWGFSADGYEEAVYSYSGANEPDTVSLENNVFTITHTLKSSASGIIQLAVLPWCDSNGVPLVEEMPLREAVSEGRFIMAVIDNAAPEVPDLRPGLSEPSSMHGDIYVYGPGAVFELTLEGLAGINDNGFQGGIPVSRAFNLPWTMDEPDALYWHTQIGEDRDAEKINSGKLNVVSGSALNKTWNPADESKNISGLTAQGRYRVLVKFEDSLGNVSPSWIDTGLRVMYSSAEKYSVKDIKAEYTGDGTIKISWGQTGVYQSAELVIRTHRVSAAGEALENEVTRRINYGFFAHEFDTAAINDSNVREGIAVSGVYGYEISITSKNISGDSDPVGPVWVYNIPGMVTQGSGLGADSNTVMINEQLTMNNEQIRELFNDVAITNIVLTGNITLDNWQPVDFSGKNFYGNGHTVTIKSFSTSHAGNHYGLFGSVSYAEIRDLTVKYAANTSTGTNATHIGGLVGWIGGNTKINNVIVTGAGKLRITSPNDIYAGSMIGYMESTSQIENCLTDIELYAKGIGNGFIRAGGIAGFIASDGSVIEDDLMINKVTVAGIVEAINNDTSSITGFIFIGGLVGETQGFGTIQNAQVSATVRMWASNNSTDNRLAYLCGGIIGRMKEGSLLNSDFTGTIDISEDHTVSGFTWIGGAVGAAGQIWSGIYQERLEENQFGGGNNTKPLMIEKITVNGDLNIMIKSTGYIGLGGVCGAPFNNRNNKIVFEDCEYSDGSIRFKREHNGTVMTDQSIGGFASQIIMGAEYRNCKSMARLIEVIFDVDTEAKSYIRVGGFIGLSRDLIKGCFSHSPVEINIKNEKGGPIDLSAGGFIGYFQETVESLDTPTPFLMNSYSTGSVTASVDIAIHDTINILHIGGFVGRMEGFLSIENCYATGNVSLNDKSDTLGTGDPNEIYAGGFAGNIELRNNNYYLERCFSTGLVSSQGAASTRTNVYAGGFAGNLSSGLISSGLIRNCVALGKTVTVKGDNSIYPAAGRICGNDETSSAGLENNFASDSMVLEEEVYGSFNPSGTTATGSANDKNGEDISNSSFYDQNFWTSASAGPGFNSGVEKPWTFTGITSRGYPVLAWEFQ